MENSTGLTEPLLSSNNKETPASSPSEHLWPQSASNAQFLYSASNTFDNIEDSDDEAIPCHLVYDVPTSSIHIVSSSSSSSSNDSEDVVLLDSFHPSDVIGAELQVQWKELNDDEKGTCPNEPIKESSSINENDISQNANPSDESKVTQTLQQPDQDDNEQLENEEEDDNMDVNAKLTSHVASALLNIWCYPKQTANNTSSSYWNMLYSSSTSNAVSDTTSVPKVGNGTLPRHAKHFTLLTSQCEDFADARCTVRSIRCLAKLRSPPSGRRRYLVVLNPYSGTGKGMEIYRDTVKVMLDQAGVDHDLFVTEYGGHASERVLEGYCGGSKKKSGDDDGGGNEDSGDDLTKYDAMVAMGGDGILYEALQGIYKRSDFKQLLETLKFGIVGCGTSNGLAKSILYAGNEIYSPLESTFLLCKGHTRHLDLSTYETSAQSYLSFLTFSYGFIADIDIESECIHCLGSIRHDIWAVWRILYLKSYPAKFYYYMPPPSTEGNAAFKMPELNDAITPKPADHDDSSSSSGGWKMIEDEFVHIWACQVSHPSYNVMNSPNSTLDDGLFRVFIIRKPCTRWNLAKMCLQLENGEHLSTPGLEVINCTAYRLEPATSTAAEDGVTACKGINVLDGEVVESGIIQAMIMPKAMMFFTCDDDATTDAATCNDVNG